MPGQGCWSLARLGSVADRVARLGLGLAIALGVGIAGGLGTRP